MTQERLPGEQNYLLGATMRPQVVLFQRDASTGVSVLFRGGIQVEIDTFTGLGISGTVTAFALSGTKLYLSVAGDNGRLVC